MGVVEEGLLYYFHQFQNHAGNHLNHAKSLDSALCENESGALSANQNTGLQCKINAHQGVVECHITVLMGSYIYYIC